MDQIETEILSPDAYGIGRAVAIWRESGLVAFPTETVYGLGADACNGKAVARIYAAKGRPSFNPLIIHVADIENAKRFAIFDDLARLLAASFWPGPLSLVLPLRPDSGLSELVTAGLDTVAIRVPENPFSQQLLRAFDGPIAAPSANISGRTSATTAHHVLDGLFGRINAVIDGGDCLVGLESTILMPGSIPPALLRPGGLSADAIEALIGQKLARLSDPKHPTSPGQLAAHYAPRFGVQLNVTDPVDGLIWLGFGPDCAKADLNLSPTAELTEAAANLFGMLHSADAMAENSGASGIGVAPIPMHGLGIAINDRLSRAARSG